MRVEIVLLNAERCGDLTTFIKLLSREHDLIVVVLNDITISIGQITSWVNRLPFFIQVDTIFVLEYYEVTLVITVQLSKNIILVESSLVSTGRGLNSWRLMVLEVLEGIVVDLYDRSVASVILGLL